MILVHYVYWSYFLEGEQTQAIGSIEIVPQIRSGLSSFCLASTSFEYFLLCKGQTEIKMAVGGCCNLFC
jgi:hypothetical protein